MVEKNLFRRDLYHRLNVVSIEIPPLRERGEDIVLLANHFIEEFNKQFSKSVKKLDKDVQHLLLGHPWHGNVRELRNAIERAVLLSDERRLQLKDFSHLLDNIQSNKTADFGIETIPSNIVRLDINYGLTSLRVVDKEYASKVLSKMGGNKTQTAKLLGISRPKLDTLLKE